MEMAEPKLTMKNGIATILDPSTGLIHSCHPNISTTGSIRGMKKLGYWGKNDHIVRKGGFYYNKSILVINDYWDRECAYREGVMIPRE
jgi:hypothetical protein